MLKNSTHLVTSAIKWSKWAREGSMHLNYPELVQKHAEHQLGVVQTTMNSCLKLYIPCYLYNNVVHNGSRRFDVHIEHPRSFSNHIIAEVARWGGLRVVQVHWTFSNILGPHYCRNVKVCRVPSHVFGVVWPYWTFSKYIFNGDARWAGYLCTSSG